MRGQWVLLVAVVVLTEIGVGRGLGGEEPKPSPRPSPIDEAQKYYEKVQTVAQKAKSDALAEAELNYLRAMRLAKQEYLAELTKAKIAAMKEDNLEKANRIESMRKRAEAELKALDSQEATAPLSLETNEVEILAGKYIWIGAKTGKIESAKSRTAVLKVAVDKDKGLKISTDSEANPDNQDSYQVVVKGTAGPEVIVKVVVLRPRLLPPSGTMIPLILDKSRIEWKEKEKAETNVKVTVGKAQSVEVKDKDKGLDAKVKDEGKRIKITASKDITAGQYEVLVTGENGKSARIEVQVLSKKVSAGEITLAAPPIEPTVIEFTEGKGETRTLKRKVGKFLDANLSEPVKGLTPKVEDEGKTLTILATKDLRAGRYEIIFTEIVTQTGLFTQSVRTSNRLTVIVKK